MYVRPGRPARRRGTRSFAPAPAAASGPAPPTRHHRPCGVKQLPHSCPTHPELQATGGAPMVGRLNHVAIAVPDLGSATKLYRDVMGGDVSEPEVRSASAPHVAAPRGA